MTGLILHSAPDNASLCIRLALVTRGIPHDLVRVDKRGGGLDTPAFRRVNPHGLIPALETPEGPLFETAAILLWLADRHGAAPRQPDSALAPPLTPPLAPPPDDPARGRVLSWLFWMSNSLHSALRILFYPRLHIAEPGLDLLAVQTRTRLRAMLDQLDAALPELDGWLGGASLSVLDCYLLPMLRWMAIYPQENPDWFRLDDWPGLAAVAARAETGAGTGAIVRAIAAAEGLGDRPFTAPRWPVSV